jgi:hypothetical protein
MREFHKNMAELHRAMESRHRAADAMHSTYARRLEKWRDQRPQDAPPPFMSAVAEISGSGSALITLWDEAEVDALVAASDGTAETAHDLESMFGEGPARDAAHECGLVSVPDTAFERRWPMYGPMVGDLGVRSIMAAPLRVSRHCFGALTVFHRGTTGTGATSAKQPPLNDVADALTHTVLLANQLPLFEDADRQSVVNHAAGLLAERSGCTIDDALALIRASAFARDERIATVAALVARGELNLEYKFGRPD